ncbi:MAG: RNA methyltransferase [Chlamydiia bacterium]|nr:RNA methyltransferase [Chlamydiia bacterium]
MIQEILKTYPSQKIIETLQPYLSEERIEGMNAVLSHRIHGVHVAIEAPYDIHNALAVVRTAEALGIGYVHFINAIMKKGQGKSTTKGTLKWVHLMRHETLGEFLQEKGDFLLAGACADASLTLEDLPTDRPLCFLFGNEKEGLTAEAQKACDLYFSVPMFGMVESLNLSVAAGISLYDYLKRKRQEMEKQGDLDPESLLNEKAHFYIRSLGIELSSRLLERE